MARNTSRKRLPWAKGTVSTFAPESCRDGGGRPAARASGDPVEVPRVAGRAVVRVDGGRGRGELVGERLAEHDGARPPEPDDAVRIRGGDVIAEEGRAVGGPHAGRLDDVLRAVRNSVKRAPPLPRGDLGLGSPRLLERAVSGQREEGRERPVQSFDPAQVSCHDLERGDLPPADEPAEIVNAELTQAEIGHRLPLYAGRST